MGVTWPYSTPQIGGVFDWEEVSHSVCFPHFLNNNEQSMFWKVNLEDHFCCNQEGSNLYYDRVRGLWVPSGKMTGKGHHIIIRHLEHSSDKAKLKRVLERC
jgi:hypothetical protein